MPTLNPDQCHLLTTHRHQDLRGWFVEAFNSLDFENLLNFKLAQINCSASKYGVIRGLHAQASPMAQSKIITVLRGTILDVTVNIQKHSPDYGQIIYHQLNALDAHYLYVPKNYLHGFVVLSEQALVQYYVDEFYAPEHEIGVIYNDHYLNINWHIPLNHHIVSNKDLSLGSFTMLKT